MERTRKFYKNGQHLTKEKSRSNISFTLKMDNRYDKWTTQQKKDAIEFLKDCIKITEFQLYSFPADLVLPNTPEK